MTAAQLAFWDTALARAVQNEEWKNELEKNEAVPDYVNSKQTPQRLAKLYEQLRSALVDAGLAKTNLP
jgi:tripartite-type tricarboxylate transporter receptor subunit TctC